MTLRVVLVDDHAIVREGIRTLLVAHDDMEIVGEADSVAGALAVVAEHRPDVVVMDIRLTDGSGIEATREIRERHPDTRILMLTSYDDREALLSSIMAGANGYVLKRIGPGELVPAVRAVGQGLSLIDPALTGAVLEQVRAAQPAPAGRKGNLNAQEERILALVTDGLTNKEIADRLGLSDKTVRNYVSSILGKLEVGRRSEAAAWFARHTVPGSDPT